MRAAQRGRQRRPRAQQAIDVLVRHEVADEQHVRGADAVARARRVAQPRGDELGADGHADDADLRRLHAEAVDDGSPRVLGVGDDRARAPRVEARGRGQHGVAQQTPAAVADEEQVVDRDHDGARRDERRLVIGRQEDLRPVARQRAWQRHLIPPPRSERHQPRERRARGHVGRRGARVAVHGAVPATGDGAAHHLTHVAPDPGARSGAELTRVDRQADHARRLA